MEAEITPKSLHVSVYQSKLHDIPEDWNIYTHTHTFYEDVMEDLKN
jgi:hypothetical protein